MADGTAPTSSAASLLAALVARGTLEGGHALAPAPGHAWWLGRRVVAAIRGSLTIAGHAVTLRVGVTREFPLALPEIAVEGIEPPLVLPHVDDGDGKLCFEAEDGVLLDRDDPLGILLESVDLARALLERMITSDRAGEFAQEIVAYWRRFAAKGSEVQSAVAPRESAAPVTALFVKGRLWGVAEKPQEIAQSLPLRTATSVSHRNAIYLPVDPDTDSAFVPRDLLRLDVLSRLARACSADEWKRREQLLLTLEKREEFVLLGVKRPAGERALVGVNFLAVRGGHPMLVAGSVARALPVEVRRRDREYLAPRGGAGNDLAAKRVLLAGCGSVGGHVALALARAGVGHLTLVDQDAFEMANTYRHVCGMVRDGEAKANGLKTEIERLVPHITIEPHRDRIERLVSGSPAVLRGVNLIVFVLGAPTIELALNEWLWRENGPAAVFAWLEPLGLGHHALRTRPTRDSEVPRGCFECLHSHEVVGGRLANRAAFAAPGRYVRDTLGCGNQHLPFGDLDASEVANAASRLALEALRGDTRPALVSRKGDAASFRAQGFSTTSRFALRQDEIDAQREAFVRRDCRICAP